MTVSWDRGKEPYVNHSLTLEAEPICGAELVAPEKGVEMIDCQDCDAVISRTLDALAKFDA